MARSPAFLLLAAAAMCVATAAPGALAAPALVDKHGNLAAPAPMGKGGNVAGPALVDKDGKSPAAVASQAATAAAATELPPAAKTEVKPKPSDR